MRSKPGFSIGNRADFYAGLLFVAFGVAALALTWRNHYPLGTAAQMGPGYFPVILGVGLLGLGLAIAARATQLPAEGLPVIAWRPFIAVIGSVVFFALTVERLGLAISGVLLIVGCRIALPTFRWREVVAFSVVLVGLSCAGFITGLGIPLQVWP